MLGLLDMMKRTDGIELSVLSASADAKEYIQIREDGVQYHIVPFAGQTAALKKQYRIILEKNSYDVIHIFGSEYISSFVMAEAVSELGLDGKTLLHIQGLVSVYAQHFAQGIPKPWVYLKTPRDLYQDTSIAHQKRDFVSRGVYERRTLRSVQNIGFRTWWDRACAWQINPEAHFFYNGEILRESFYEGDWSLETCERHSVFISQGNYPIKGLHQMLLALPYIIPHFPDVKVYIAGYSPVGEGRGIIPFLKRSGYGHYLAHLIKKHGLAKHLVFTGPLMEKQMRERYLKSHVFVCPSSIENSPNSLGEAMILGMPCIAAFVGGIPDMAEHEKQGLLYSFDAPYMLANDVMRFFKDDQLCLTMGKAAKARAMHTHDKTAVLDQIMSAYQAIREGKS